MSETKFTPGPWKFYWRKEVDEANCGVLHEPREGHARSIARCPRYESEHQWKANAALIAAAPELYAALKKSDGLIEHAQALLAAHLPPDGMSEKDLILALLELFDGPEQREIQGATKAALKKARGES